MYFDNRTAANLSTLWRAAIRSIHPKVSVVRRSGSSHVPETPLVV